MVSQKRQHRTTAEFGRLSDKRILVTGASSGIGSATAELLAKEGAVVGIHYNKNKEAAYKLQERIRRAGGKAEVLEADLLIKESRDRLIAHAIRTLGWLDALINNAGGVMRPASVWELSESAWRQTFMLNVESPFFLAQAALAHMRTARGGKIINISSIGVKFGGSPQTLHYAAAKSALETVTRGLAKAAAPYGIMVNAIRPGVTSTAFHAGKTRAEWQARVNLIPLKRACSPKDIAGMVLYLLSPAANGITGQVFTVSGGE